MGMIGKIRRLHSRGKKSEFEIARLTGLSRNTVSNAWLADRCRALWSEVRHPEHAQFSVAEMLEHERAQLMPIPEPFDGYVEKPARVTSTCLVAVARNCYSVPCELAGQMISTRLFPSEIIAVAGDRIVARHWRLSSEGQTA